MADAKSINKKRITSTWKWLLRGAVVFLLLALLGLISLPHFVAYYLKTRASSLLGRYLAGEIRLEQVSLGWFRPLTIRGIRLFSLSTKKSIGSSDQDRLLGTIESLETEVSLWTLLGSPHDLGTVRVHAPKAHVTCVPNESNWEEFLRPLMELPVSKRPLAVRWELRNAEILVKNAEEPVIIRCQLPQVEGSWRRGSPWSLELNTQGEVEHQQSRGHLSVTVTTRTAADSGSDAPVPVCTVQWHDLPLELLRPLATRLRWNLTAAGRTSGTCEGYLIRDGKWRWTDVTVTSATFAEQELLREPLRCDRIATSGALVCAEQTWNLEAQAESDLGSVEIAAQGMPRQVTDWTALWRTATRLSLRADVDVAQLVSRLPQTLRVIDGLELASARITVRADLDRKHDASLIFAEILASDWQARYQNHVVVWPQPLSAKIAFRVLSGQWKVEELTCQSEFLTATWQRGADGSEVAIAGDLGRLDARLHQFFHWPFQLAGLINGTVTWQYQSPDTHVGAQLGITNWSISYNGRQFWSEPDSSLHALAKFQSDGNGQSLRLAGLELLWVSGSDRCKATLAEPAVLGGAGRMTWHVDVVGELPNWQRRCSLLSGQRATWQLGGRLEAAGELTTVNDSLAVENLRALWVQAQVAGEQWVISEPQLELSLGRLALENDGHTLATKVENLRLHGTSISVSAPDLLLQWPSSPPTGGSEDRSWKGTVDFQVNLAGLQLAPSVHEVHGTAFVVDGHIRGRVALDAVSAAHMDVHDLKITQTRWLLASSASPNGQSAQVSRTVIWQDPQVQLDAAFRWRQGATIEFDRLDLVGGGWSCQTRGAVQSVSNVPMVLLDGSLTYDWEQLRGRSPLLAAKHVIVTGQRSTAFSVSGPLWPSPEETYLLPAGLKARLAVGWDAAEVFGVVAGPGTADVALQGAVVRISIPELPVSGGVMRANPSVDFRGARPVLLVAPGQLLDGVELTPAICRSWLQYIHPLVAGATRAQGRLGLYLDSCRVPLDAVREAEVAGTLRLESGSVGAGPLTQEVIGVMERVAALVERRLPRLSALARDDWIEMPPQQVAFRVESQQVTHQGLKMFVRDVPIATQGSVGFDQSLRLDLDLTIPDRWTDNRPLLAHLRGRTIRVPIRGSLTRPELDEQFFTELARQLLGGSAGRILEEGLLRGLDRLLKDR